MSNDKNLEVILTSLAKELDAKLKASQSLDIVLSNFQLSLIVMHRPKRQRIVLEKELFNTFNC